MEKNRERRLRVAVHGIFQGCVVKCIQKEVGDLLAKHNLDVVYSRSGILGKEGN